MNRIPLNVLIVDPEPDTRHALTDVLRQTEAVQAVADREHLAAASDELARTAINVIFIDPISLGLEDASTFIFGVRQTHPTIAFVLYIDAEKQRQQTEVFFRGERQQWEHYYTLDKATPSREFAGRVQEVLAQCQSYLAAVAPQVPGEDRPPEPQGDARFDGIIRTLVDGNEEQRADALHEIRGLDSADKVLIARRLRLEIEGPFSVEQEREFASAAREPKKLSSIRSWMLSSLIWADPDAPENRTCIFHHLQEETEPDRSVRFWVLAGLYQRDVSYVADAVGMCRADSMPEVQALAKAISSRHDPGVQAEFRVTLGSPQFETIWPVLRVLRVVPIPQLAEDVCALLARPPDESPLVYDTFYALTRPAMAAEAAAILARGIGIDGVVERMISVARHSNENAVRNFAVLLAQFEARELDAILERAVNDSKTKDLALLLRDFLHRYRSHSNRDYQETYARFLPDRAAYGSRDAREPLDDSLGVGVYAGHLAQLIAAKDTWMPLSIGLFGAWGAGKTHFMDLLEERLRDVTKESHTVFHRQIVQIRFNAWHYLDTNLWANLVCEIFDQLFAKLDERTDTTTAQVEKLRTELAKQSALAAEAREVLKTAEAARVEAEEELRKAMQKRIAQEATVSALLDDLTTLVKNDHELQKQLRAVAEGLGLPKLQTSFAELEARVGEARSLGGRTKALGVALFTGAGWWKRSLLLVAALVVPLGVGWLAAHGPKGVQDLLAGAGRTVAQVITALTGVSAWLSVQTRAGGSLLGKLESAYDRVKQVRAKREAKDDAVKAQAELTARRQAEEQARHTLLETEAKMKAIHAELAELAPGRQLIRFLKERASAEDYRRHLGLVSVIRKDFERLSLLLTQAAENRDPTLPQIDRIVLYIDDLDRCRAARVIEVLEAVHLLLAFPLFAVVVAVDPRWLRQSLLDHYPRLLGGAIDTQMNTQSGTLGRPATPQDYLEKIFQIPFNLHAMDKTGFEKLVNHLLSAAKSSSRPSEQSEGPAPDPKAPPSPTDPNAPGLPVDPSCEDPTTPQPKPSDPKPPSPDKPPETPPPDPQRLMLTSWEAKDLQRFQPLFATPRAVKRFVNTYALVRVGVEKADWSDYVGAEEAPGNYRVPMLLLSVTSAFPCLARPWLLWLREKLQTQWLLTPEDEAALVTKHADTTDSTDWDRLGRALASLNLSGWPTPDPDALTKWVPRVARYSF